MQLLHETVQLRVGNVVHCVQVELQAFAVSVQSFASSMIFRSVSVASPLHSLHVRAHGFIQRWLHDHFGNDCRIQAGEQTLGPGTFGSLTRALGVFGLAGIDRLLSLRAAEVRCHDCPGPTPVTRFHASRCICNRRADQYLPSTTQGIPATCLLFATDTGS